MGQAIRIGVAFAVLLESAHAQSPSWNYAEQEKLIPPAFLSAGDECGRFVALSGDWAVVGAWSTDLNTSTPNVGAAYVFERSGLGWTYNSQLLPSTSRDTDDVFGWGVDIDGDTIVVGARLDDVTAPDSGAAYVYVLSNGSWVFQQALTGAGGASESFGVDVAIEGDLIVCGAHGYGASYSGAAYVFARQDAGTPNFHADDSWCQVALLSPSGPAGVWLGDHFGVSVAVNDAPGAMEDRVAVGAFFDDENAAIDTGSAYVFGCGDNGTPSNPCDDVWVQEGAKVFNPNYASGDNFGISVAVESDTLVVGAHLTTHLGVMQCGSISIFDRQAGPAWALNSQHFASNFAAGDVLGHSVAISGDTIVAGAHGAQVYGSADEGSLYVFTRTGTNSWAQRLQVATSDASQGDQFGVGVDIDGNAIIAGAYLDSVVGVGSGSAYVFTHQFDTYTTFCHGDGSLIACPCANNSNPLTKQGCINSVGRGGILRPGGSANTTGNDLEFYAANLPFSNSCLLFGGTSGSAAIPFSSGVRCIPSPIRRLGLRASSSTGHVNWGPGFAIAPWSAGQTWYFQVWYRDPTNMLCTPAKPTNVTNGVQVTF